MSITEVLQYKKSTKAAHVYHNANFSAIYVPKDIVQKLCSDRLTPKSTEYAPPTFLKLTLESEGANYA